MSTQSQDDQVLAKLYKEGAKETPSPELDKKILNYAANKHKAKRGSSYFSGGWKVPLSLAASITIVFAIIMQIQQVPDQTEIPRIPASKPADNLPATVDEMREDAGSQYKAKDAPGRKEDLLTPLKSTGEMEATKKREQIQIAPQSQTIQEESLMLENEIGVDEAAAGKLMRQRTMSTESISSPTPKESSVQNQQDKFNVDQETDTSKLPVEDWLLLIETLIAKKDYAEARRQLEQFKIVHPKVNVEDLESKIP